MPPSVPLSARSSIRWILPVLVLAVIAVPLLGSLDATGKPNRHPELRDFLRTGKYAVHLEGAEVQDAKLYHSAPSAAYLIVADVFDTAILVMPRTGCVETVAADEMKIQEDGSIDLIVDATPCRLGKFRLEGADVVFRVKDATARLTPKPPLIGTHWSAQVLEHSPEYGQAAKVYRPDMASVEALANSKAEARVQIFFGTWCSFCNRFLPNTLKLEEELKKRGSSISFEFHGLPAPPAAWVTPEATRYQVTKLPTGFVFVNDRQVGRLEGNDWIRPEVALARVLR